MEKLEKIESLYIHFPYCKHLCNYCDFYKTIINDAQVLKSFSQYLDQAFLVHNDLLSQNHFEWGKLRTLYIGGGTPSLWDQEGRTYLKNLLESKLQLASDYEFTVEMNPGTINSKTISEWQNSYVNRFSIGVQALREDYLKILDRFHSLEDVYKSLDLLQKSKVNYSVDFMLGLPQSRDLKRNIIEELKAVLKYEPQHFSIYILTVKNQYPHFKNLPDEEFLEEEYLKVSDFLQSEGFNHYEVSNFARDGKVSKHNYRYWEAQNVAALGPSATGFLATKDYGLRYKWKTSQVAYEVEKLNSKDLLLERIFLSLRIDRPFYYKDAFAEWSKLEPLWASWQKRGLAQYEEGEWVKLNSRGFLVMDSLLNEVFSITSF